MADDYTFASEPVPIEDQPHRNLIVLLLDVSGSMVIETGEPPRKKIDQLKDALDEFLTDGMHYDDKASGQWSRLEVNGEIAVAVFGNEKVDWLPLAATPVAPGSHFYPVQRVDGLSDAARSKLKADGDTPMAKAVLEGLAEIERRKAQLHEAGISHEFRPNMLLLTDGEPSTNISAAAQELHAQEDQKRVLFWAFGTKEAETRYLYQLANKGGTKVINGKKRPWSNCNELGIRPLSAFLQFVVRSYRYQPKESADPSAEDAYIAVALMDDDDMPRGF